MTIPFVDLREHYAAIAPSIDEALKRVIESAIFIGGPEVEKFEREFADFCEIEHIIGTGSGTAALELIFRALPIKPGDEVIVAANSYIATALAASAVGAKVVFVDCDPRTYNMNPDKLETAITSRTKAVAVTHLYGQPADMDRIVTITRAHGLLLVEDACQSHGARYGGKRVGTFGDAAAFSFYPGKNLGAYGDAGAIATNDNAFAEKCEILREYGQTEKYVHVTKGTNSRLDALQAAILRVQLKHLSDWNGSRRRAATMYSELLSDTPVSPPYIQPNTEHVFHVYAVEVENRDQLRDYMHSRGISTNIHYPIPIHLQQAYSELEHTRGDFPVAEAAADRLISLPLYPELKHDQIEEVVTALKGFYRW